MQGKFIVFEGIDGSGKTTQLKILEEELLKNGLKVYRTSEPTDSPMGKMIRDIFRGELGTNQQTIAALFLADRLDHLQKPSTGIIEMLRQGYHVLCDRYYFSSYAYHGVHMPLDRVIDLNIACAELLRPDLNIFIDIDPEKSMERLTKSRENIEIYETLSNLRNVRAKYLESFELLKAEENIVMIDGNDSLENVSSKIREEVISLLGFREQRSEASGTSAEC